MKRKIQSIQAWTDAFLIFLGIYIAKFRETFFWAFKLKVKMNTIRSTVATFAAYGWRNYAEQVSSLSSET